ncbi:hematopoietic SH2 domain-containing protein homolog isoform 2-T2 [Odontesthes bonariensis]
MSKPPGYFLIRVSESRIGYTLSYRDEGHCRHFMVDVLEDGQYIIVGESRRHRFLHDLVDLHRRTPIMPFNQVLTVACGQSSNDRTDYAELLFPQKHPTSNSSSLQNYSPLPSTSHQVSQDDVRPALPYRPNNLMNSTVQSPNSQPNRLYPCLEDHIASPLPATPVPKTRRRYAADNPPSNQPPEVPSRSFLPQRQNQVCIRTVSAVQSACRAMPSIQTLCTEVHLHDAKMSVVANLKNLKKKFQKKTSTSQDNTYAEINLDTSDMSEDTEHEYQEITGEQTFSGSHLYDTDVTDQVLPQEYMSPPPFAPGF